MALHGLNGGHQTDGGDTTVIESYSGPDSAELETASLQNPAIHVQVCGYGEEAVELSKFDRHAIIEWLRDCFNWIGYHGTIHLVWYQNADSITTLKHAMVTGVRHREPVFLYRCTSSMSLAPEGYYWSQMDHPSRSLYQLEKSNNGLNMDYN